MTYWDVMGEGNSKMSFNGSDIHRIQLGLRISFGVWRNIVTKPNRIKIMPSWNKYKTNFTQTENDRIR